MTLNPKLESAIKKLRIADVILKSIDATLMDDFFPDLSEDTSALSVQTVAPSCRAISNFDRDDLLSRRSVFEMFAGLRLLKPHADGYRELSSEQLDELVCAKVECVFLVSYDEEITGDAFLDEDSLALFAQHNVPFNMWPYWREVVQSACSRMGLPRVVLPTHRLKRSALAKS
ncbi:hypothetical protein [Thermomonas brevis]